MRKLRVAATTAVLGVSLALVGCAGSKASGEQPTAAAEEPGAAGASEEAKTEGAAPVAGDDAAAPGGEEAQPADATE